MKEDENTSLKEQEFHESLSASTSNARELARMAQWLATAGRGDFDRDESDEEPNQRLAGLIEALIVVCKQLRSSLSDSFEGGYPAEQLPRILLEIGRSYGCTSEIMWASERQRAR